jgi:hypothetical protein
MDLEHIVGMQPALYHRYNVDENEEEDEDSEPFKAPFNPDNFHGTQVCVCVCVCVLWQYL